jgi:hydroxymethylpyrimidine/phosphomethylpyrimidine kinase
MNILYSEEAIKACEEMGLSVSFYDRREEPDEIKDIEGMTTKWGAEQAVKRIGKAPDAIYHFGDWGKEPMIVLLGKDAVQIAERAAQIAKKIE